MLSGGMTVQGNPMKVSKSKLAPNGAGLGFCIFLYFGANGMTVSHFFESIDLPRPRAPIYVQNSPTYHQVPQIRAISGPSSIFWPSFRTSRTPI